MKLQFALLTSLVAAQIMSYIKEVRDIKQNQKNFKGDSFMRQYLKDYNKKLAENEQPSEMQRYAQEDVLQHKINKLYKFFTA